MGRCVWVRMRGGGVGSFQQVDGDAEIATPFSAEENGVGMIYAALRNRKIDLVAIGGGAAAGPVAALRATVGALRRDAIAFGVEDDEAARTFAGAGGLQAGVAEEEMQHATLTGVHGLEAEGLAGVLDFLDGSVGCLAEGACA